MSRPRIPESDRQLVRDLAANGMIVAEIARQTGIPRTTCRDIIHPKTTNDQAEVKKDLELWNLALGHHPRRGYD